MTELVKVRVYQWQEDDSSGWGYYFRFDGQNYTGHYQSFKWGAKRAAKKRLKRLRKAKRIDEENRFEVFEA